MAKGLKELLSPRNYIPNFLKIRTKDAQLVPLVPKRPQEKLLETVEDCRRRGKPVRIIILKARQMGFSTYVEALIFNDETTNKLKNGVIIAHQDDASQNLYTMYKTFYDYLPEELQPMRSTANSQELLFENPTQNPIEKKRNPGLQSRIKIATARNIDTGRSSTIHNLHASEVAFWQDAATLMTGLMQCVPDTPNSAVYIESTANGVGGWFYNFWHDAESGENDYIPLFFAWFEEPEYTLDFESDEDKQNFIERTNYSYKDKDGNVIHTEEWELMDEFKFLTWEQMNWRKHTIKNKCHGDLDKFHQEYPSTPEEAFIASGRPRFNVSALKKFRKICKPGKKGFLEYKGDTVVFIENPKGYVEIWDEPEPDAFYSIGADVAEGLAEGDYSVAYVSSTKFDIHAKWRGHIDPDLFGDELVKLAIYYNQAYLAPESNNHGLTTLKAIQRKDYYNIFFTKTYDKLNDTITQKIGWRTDQRTKPLMIDKLAEWVREGWLGIKDIDLVNELLTYVIEDNGSTNAQNGCHDDCVMAIAITLQVVLEGKSDTFTPYSTDESKVTTVNRDGFIITKDEDIDEEDKAEIAY